MSREFGQVCNDLLMEIDTNIKLDSVILSEENKQKVGQFIKENEYKHKFHEYGLKPINKLLFYGASGCGKTFLAKALSNHLKYKMLYVDIARSLTAGKASVNISKIFRVANTEGNCMIFLDECDSIAWNRDTSSPDRGDIRRATNSLFQQLDQMSYNNIFISATNVLHRLDPAFERRFNMKLEFRRPEVDLKQTIRQFLLNGFKLEDNVDKTIQTIVERRARLSYYEIQDIVERAMKKSLINNTTIVYTSNMYEDFATAANIKIRFKTDKDSEEIFQSTLNK